MYLRGRQSSSVGKGQSSISRSCVRVAAAAAPRRRCAVDRFRDRTRVRSTSDPAHGAARSLPRPFWKVASSSSSSSFSGGPPALPQPSAWSNIASFQDGVPTSQISGMRSRRSAHVRTLSASASCISVTRPMPPTLRTGMGARNSRAAARPGRTRVCPSGLRTSAAIFASLKFGARPPESVRPPVASRTRARSSAKTASASAPVFASLRSNTAGAPPPASHASLRDRAAAWSRAAARHRR